MSAPLPFVGQKRMFAREFIKVLGQFPDSTVFVDLFGGSGLLSHITKCVRPDATVVYNDFDNYRCRLVNIPATNVLLSDLRRIAEGEPRNKRITGEVRDKMFARIEREEKEHGYVDYITVSASLLFAMKYVTSLEGMKKEAIYNRIRQTDYPEAKDYLEGLLGVSSSTIFKGKGYIQLETEDDIDKVYEPGVYAIKGTSYNDQTLLVFSHNLGQSTVQFRTNNYGGFLVFRIKWWNGGWGTWKTVSLT